ncbi:hypothetical protein N7468_004182 [Penicillium chermesinum]|uniref:Uncharacterized protein n=1 Tax=Penicillium chermesinum TaxID=63820 RepID=A0A9W9PAE0_9EURO|nr:uncharacterized protein N7468_004182 [Penicillium chermesinum]KAJ5239563.1 hypothetical protein N7468_004182 [Penicillium chermesinum]KAJ6141188.1 hypothetical protein N7470_010084 [Penicillium chermesinum]
MTSSPPVTYIQKVVEADQVLWEYNILASIAHWVLLAGYLILPGTFTSLQNSDGISHKLGQSQTGKAILNQIQNPPLIVLGCLFFFIGTCGIGGLYWKHQNNYIWLADIVKRTGWVYDNNDKYIYRPPRGVVNHGTPHCASIPSLNIGGFGSTLDL